MNTTSLAATRISTPRRTSLSWLTPVLVIAALAALPSVLSSYMQDLALTIIVYAIFALSLELLVGKTGLISLGHAAFFGIAAYVAARLSPDDAAGSIAVLLPMAVLGAGVYALAVGALSLRTKGVYFIMVTLAFAQMAYFVVHDTPIGGGSDGIYLTLRPALEIGGKTLIDLDKSGHMYFFALGVLAFTYGFLAVLERSRFGHALAGIRVNEQRMRAAGFNTYYYKLAAFVIAGMLAGLAGFLKATKTGYVNPEMLSWHESGAVLLMIILGGLGSFRGAVIGAVAFVLLKEFYASEAILGAFAQRWQLTLGLTMILFVALLPHGLIGIGQWIRNAARMGGRRPAREKTGFDGEKK
ncbi:MAG TPA: branched-chain amino acid ABC transporter permease [Noviherbaspirillum sp.]|jgi:branched-chain amino acid transport system permease protein|uniref:branched-chain amino acid ABC transporter permease n=1 Tax=Noviherbaspirillum sp. TaxID=1926288 RepID=UPI002DDD3DB5|nr:branched-chain amino acid ABC transporter permease [Noviherbaspirillum sp.]HEV2612847.1 branched-chain amino acid ABC transporter permease [Noviherbaspirillum sp.]